MPFPSVQAYFIVGKTLRSHSTAGQLRVAVEDRLKGYLKKGRYIFFNHDGSHVPYRITGFEDDVHTLITLEDVKGKQASDRLAGQQIRIPLDEVQERHLLSPANLTEEWEGYTIVDNASSRQFILQRTEQFPQQMMAVVLHEDREVLIPLHELLITGIDRQQKIIRMDIPEGLLEL